MQEPKRLGLVKSLRLLNDGGENPFVRLEVTFVDDRSSPVSLDIRTSLVLRLAEQILALAKSEKLG